MTNLDFISSLPTEVLGEIFFFCSILASDAPIILSLVSHTFHQVTSQTPHIWSRLHLQLTETNAQACAHKTTLWLVRSKSCPIDLFMEASHISTLVKKSSSLDTPASLDFLFSLFGVLHGDSLRFRSFNLRTATEEQARFIFDKIFNFENAISRPDAELRTLTIHAASGISTSNTLHQQASIPISYPLPNLHHLKITNFTLPCLSTSNLTNLRTLTIANPIKSAPIPTSAILHLLQSVPSLERLEIETRVTIAVLTPNEPSDETEETQAVGVVTLLFLQRFYLRCNNLPSILGRLTLPSLHTLHIDDLDGRRTGSTEETGSALRQLLMRMDLPTINNVASDSSNQTITSKGVGMGLRKLTLLNVNPQKNIGNGIWEWCFRRMKAVTQLHAFSIDAFALFALLSPSSTLPPNSQGEHRGLEQDIDIPCPSLKVLNITANTGPDVDVGVDEFSVSRPDVHLRIDYSIPQPWSLTGLEDFIAAPTPRNGEGLLLQRLTFGAATGVPRRRSDGKQEGETH